MNGSCLVEFHMYCTSTLAAYRAPAIFASGAEQILVSPNLLRCGSMRLTKFEHVLHGLTSLLHAFRCTVLHDCVLYMLDAQAQDVCGCAKHATACFVHAGNFQNVYPELVNLEHYSIQGNKHEDGVHKVLVEVTPPNHTGQKPQFVFILAEKDIGAKQGALMTRCLIRHKS